VRKTIRDGVELEVDRPTCLCRLEEDEGMNATISHHGSDLVSVRFVEAVDYWTSLAASQEAASS
jgi:hypothetical protein